MNNYWKQIANNCKQIKSLRLRIEVNESLRINEELISILKQFKQLKRLKLDFSEDLEYDQLFEFYPFKDLKVLEGLTHLRIRGLSYNIYYCIFNEKILTDIDINFPKLKSLEIDCPFIASEWTSQVLSKLTSLQTIELEISNDEISPEIERQLIDNCKYFKHFYNTY